MTEFTPIMSLLGGILIGASAVLLMLTNGRIAGVSGIVSGIVSGLLPPIGQDSILFRVSFVLGLILSPILYQLVVDSPIQQTISATIPILTVGGLLVGFGSVVGSGCTSGHGVCGLSRFSWRSVVATIVFMLCAGATVAVVRHVIGG